MRPTEAFAALAAFSLAFMAGALGFRAWAAPVELPQPPPSLTFVWDSRVELPSDPFLQVWPPVLPLTFSDDPAASIPCCEPRPFIFTSREDLLRILRSLPPETLALVGYAGADGDAHALSWQDLHPETSAASGEACWNSNGTAITCGPGRSAWGSQQVDCQTGEPIGPPTLPECP